MCVVLCCDVCCAAVVCYAVVSIAVVLLSPDGQGLTSWLSCLLCFVTFPMYHGTHQNKGRYPGIQFRLPCTPQDNFSWVPNCSLGPPGCETKVSSKKFWFGLCEIAWFLWQPIANLRMGVCLQNYSYLSCYLS